MSENLFCKDQKVATDKFRNGFDNIRWDSNNDMKIPVNGTVFYDGRCVGQLYPIDDKNNKDFKIKYNDNNDIVHYYSVDTCV